MAAASPVILCFEKQRLIKEFERAVSELHRMQPPRCWQVATSRTSHFENRLPPRANGGTAPSTPSSRTSKTTAARGQQCHGGQKNNEIPQSTSRANPGG